MQLALTSEVYAANMLITLGLSSSLWLYVSVDSLPDGVRIWGCFVFKLKMALLNLIWWRQCAVHSGGHRTDKASQRELLEHTDRGRRVYWQCAPPQSISSNLTCLIYSVGNSGNWMPIVKTRVWHLPLSLAHNGSPLCVCVCGER